MSRIRTIKPEFPQSETIGHLSRDARLLFIQLWTLVDDEGRTRAPSRMLASLLYPYDDDARLLIDGWLAELVENCCIVLYEAEGSTYLEICNWLKHQKIDHPRPSKLPGPKLGFAKPRECSRSLAPDLDHGPRTKDQGIDSSLRSECVVASPGILPENKPAPRKASRAKPRTQIAEDAQPVERDREAAAEANLNAEQSRLEWRKFRDHHRAKGSLMADWSAAWRTWLDKRADFRPVARAGPRPNGSMGGGGFAQMAVYARMMDDEAASANPTLQLVSGYGKV